MKQEDILLDEAKYGNYGDFEVERYALDKFELIKRNSSQNLRSTQHYIFMGFIVVFCLSVLMGILTFVMSISTTADIQYTYEGPFSVRLYAYKLNIDVLKAYRSMRDLALANPQNRDYITNSIVKTDAFFRQTRSDANTLARLIENYPELQAPLYEVTSLIAGLESIYSDSRDYAIEGDMDSCRDNILIPGSAQVEKIGNSVNTLAEITTDLASAKHTDLLKRSKSFDIYSIILTLLIAGAGVAVIVMVRNHTSRAICMVNESQRELNEILDELMIMDETLRQNLARIEQEGEIIRDLQEKYANSLEAANDVIWEYDRFSGSFFASEKWEDITGFPKPAFLSEKLLYEMVFKEDHNKLLDALNKKSENFTVQFRVFREGAAPDYPRWLDLRGKWIDSRRITGSLSDITLKKEAEQNTEYIAYHDLITHLPNRAMFIRRLEEAITRSEKTGSMGCVMFIDLDNFKLINDSHGHDFGDMFLLEVSRRLQSVIDPHILLARFGGDEFLVLLENIPDKDVVYDLVNRITYSLNEPVTVDGNMFYLTLSIGASVFPYDGNDVNQILKNADAAMYESKSLGRGTFEFYNEGMSNKVLRRSVLSDILHTAIETGVAYLVFQPQYHSSKKLVTGCEALMRIKDPILGFVSPDEFIPVAEETRLIIPLGYWVIRQAIETDLNLRKQGVDISSVSVNVSEVQFRDPDFVHQVRRIISDYDYDASRLHFEITESILLNQIEEKILIFEELHDIGIKIELDDFGTGYSSFNYVRMIPLDVIKIDKCFVDEIGINPEKEGLIDLMIRLARMFNADVVAEGVETSDQVEFFDKIGNIILQGYYYSKPVDSDALAARINELNRLGEPPTAEASH